MQGLQVWDENGNIILDLSDNITMLVREVRIQTTQDKEKPKIVTKNSVFLINTGFYVRSLESGIYKTYHRGTYNVVHDIKETQSGDTYTIEFPEFVKGCDFTVFIGAY